MLIDQPDWKHRAEVNTDKKKSIVQAGKSGFSVPLIPTNAPPSVGSSAYFQTRTPRERKSLQSDLIQISVEAYDNTGGLCLDHPTTLLLLLSLPSKKSPQCLQR